jgi:hypothetical protein
MAASDVRYVAVVIRDADDATNDGRDVECPPHEEE